MNYKILMLVCATLVSPIVRSDACAAVLCLSSSGPAGGACTSYRIPYFDIQKWKDVPKTGPKGVTRMVRVLDFVETIKARKDYLSSCSVEDEVINNIIGKYSAALSDPGT